MNDRMFSSPEMPAKSAFKMAGFVFFGFLLVALNVLIDHRTVDVTLMPRLLALLAFLSLFLGLLYANFAGRNLLNNAPWRDPLVLAYACYALITTLSLLSALNVTAGWTDVFRTWGAFLVLLLTPVLLSVIPDWPTLIAKMGVVAGLVSAAIGYYELTTKLGFGVHDRQVMLEVKALMSNVNLYASFINLLIPLCLCGAVILRGFWRVASICVLFALLFMLLLLQTRAAYVGLAGGLIITAVVVFLGWRRLGLTLWSRTALLGAALAMLIAVVVFVTASDGNQIVERVRSIAHGDPATAAGGRLVIWKLTLEMAADHWLTGVGAGNFPVRLHDYFEIDNPDFSPIHPNWLQPHNDFLWVLSEKGVPGLLAFLAIFIFAAQHLIRALRLAPSLKLAWTAVFVVLGLVTYLIGSFFDFPQERVNHQVYLSVYLGMSVALAQAATSVSMIPVLSRRSCLLAVAVMLSTLTTGIFYSAAALRQEWYIIRARINLSDDDYESMVTNARLAATPWKSLDSFATPVAFLEGMGLMFLAQHDEAMSCFERARAQIPSRIYITKHIGLLSALRKDYRKAIDAFSVALARSPENVDTITRLALCYAESGDPTKALAMLEKIPPDRVDEHVERAFALVRRMISYSNESAEGENK